MNFRLIPTSIALAFAAIATSACNQSADPPLAAQAQAIEWREGDVDDALAEAKESGRPVLLYWGAEWCPPCAEMKVTLFKDADFIAKTRDFVPVYLDGDTAGAQKWGDRFGISGYPTVIVLAPDGREITRIASATMAEKLPALLTLAAGRSRTIDAVLADARRDAASLSADDWAILSGFDWGNDPSRFDEAKAEGALLAKLAEAAPDAAMRRRFALLALVRSVERDDDGKYQLSAVEAERVRALLPGILATPDEARANRLALFWAAPSLVAALPEGTQRDALAASLDAGLERLHADTSLSLLDKTLALYGQATLAEATGGVSAAMAKRIRARIAAIDKAADDDIVRKSVMSYAAAVLDKLGDRDAAKAMLLAEVERSSSPYYYMSELAALAADEGDGAAAVRWSRKAYEAAEGPATRIQWAAMWSRAVMEHTPVDRAAVQESAEAVIAALGQSPDGYYQRTERVMERWSKALAAWAKAHDGDAVIDVLAPKLANVCAEQGEKAKSCETWIGFA